MRRLAICLLILGAGFLAGCDAPGPGLVLDEARRPAEAADAVSDPTFAVPPVVVAEPVPEARSGAFGGQGRARAGVLTAGDIDDTLNLAAFNRYLAGARRSTGLPLTNFAAPVLAQLVGPDGNPAPGQRVTLTQPGAGVPFYDGYSGVDGMITVFPAILGAGRSGSAELRVIPQEQGEPFAVTLKPGAARARVVLPFGGSVVPDFLDLMFVVDATGSMGDELEWLTRDLNRIVSQAARGFGGVDIRYGLVMYRDDGDDYVVRSYGFTDSAGTMRAQLRAQSADGGGDYPEAAAAAMEAAVAMDWRRGRGERLLVQIADAPPHDADAGRYLAAARAAAARNIQIFGLGASGVAAEAEYLMRQAAAQTGGRYLFLTDDSGVGLAHAEPTVSCYVVTELADLMTRVLRSELTGRRVEPTAVIRQVGSPRGGVCLN